MHAFRLTADSLRQWILRDAHLLRARISCAIHAHLLLRLEVQIVQTFLHFAGGQVAFTFNRLIAIAVRLAAGGVTATRGVTCICGIVVVDGSFATETHIAAQLLLLFLLLNLLLLLLLLLFSLLFTSFLLQLLLEVCEEDGRVGLILGAAWRGGWRGERRGYVGGVGD